MKKSLAHQLADYACALRFEDLSKNVVHEVKRRVIDSLGCALGAWTAEPCAIARNVASDFSAKQGSTIIGTTHKAPPDWAAFATGCCIRYFDYNDTYLSKEPAHPSDNIAAALAVAESVGATGRELITAIALAYEVQCRFCDAASIRARGWDHVTYGAFSTALAFYDGYRCERLPANLLQAQRDFFGAHTYERVDKPRGEFFHTNWTGRGGKVSSSTYNA